MKNTIKDISKYLNNIRHKPTNDIIILDYTSLYPTTMSHFFDKREIRKKKIKEIFRDEKVL